MLIIIWLLHTHTHTVVGLLAGTILLLGTQMLLVLYDKSPTAAELKTLRLCLKKKNNKKTTKHFNQHHS